MRCWKYSSVVTLVLCVVSSNGEPRQKRDDGDTSEADAGGDSISHSDSIYQPASFTDHEAVKAENNSDSDDDADDESSEKVRTSAISAFSVPTIPASRPTERMTPPVYRPPITFRRLTSRPYVTPRRFAPKFVVASRSSTSKPSVAQAALGISRPVVAPSAFNPRVKHPSVTYRPAVMPTAVRRRPATFRVFRPMVTSRPVTRRVTTKMETSKRPPSDVQPIESIDDDNSDEDSDEQSPTEKQSPSESRQSQRPANSSVPGDRYYPAPYPQYPPRVPARYPQTSWNRPVFRPPAQHPAGRPASAQSSVSGETISGEINHGSPVFYPNHHGAGGSSDSGGDHSDADDSRESDEDDGTSYVYYHAPARPSCPYVADVVIMMDGSDSLTRANFNFGKRVIDQIISRLYLSQLDGFVVGAMFFSDSIQEVRLRPFKDNVYLRALVMNAYQEMGGTGTDYVLYNMRKLFFAEGRYGVPKIGILMTDGRARNPATSIEQARMAKSEGIHLITVAVGVVTNPLELRAIASNAGSVVLHPTTSAVLRLVQRYSSQRCLGPVPVPPFFPTIQPPRPGFPVTLPPPIFPGRPLTFPPPRTFPPQPPFPPGTPFPPFTQTPRPPFLPTPFPTFRPVPPQPPTPSPPRRGPCDDCKFLNGIGYNPHESVCSYYYQCYNSNGVLVPYQRECAFGLFWDQIDLTCKPPAAVDCATDPCKRSPQAYGAPGNCRAYWQCQWGRTISAQCCSFSHRFVSRQGCVFDTSCTVACPPYQPVRPEVCNKRPYPMDDTQYYEDIGGGRTILRRCALGSAFVPEPACRCDRRTDIGIRPWECKADLYFPFDTDLRDKSGQQLPAFVDRVTVDRTPGNGAIGGGAARFNGTGKILVWKYANDDFGTQFVIRLRYRALPSQNVSRNEGIVTNSDCREPCSVAISYNRRGNTTQAKLRTTDTGIVGGLLTHGAGWNTVEYKYDGSRLSFNVNGNLQSVAAVGRIVKVPAALQIGTGCMGYDPFTGLIDELYVYKCLP